MQPDIVETDKQRWSIYPRKLIAALHAIPTVLVASLPESLASARLADINRLIGMDAMIPVQRGAL